MKVLPPSGATIHVAGLAGVGMNAIAQVLQARGFCVTGSDRLHDQGVAVPALDILRRNGIDLYPQDGSGITATTAALVVSSAIEPDNPDLLAAQSRQLPVWHRAEALAAVIGDDPNIAIAGTSGKTTVTGMVGWLLTELGMEPNVVNGGGLLDWRNDDCIGNVRITGSPWWVVEVDESDRSLLRFQPDWALLTNISADHFPLPESIELFVQFSAGIKNTLLTDPDTLAQLDTDPAFRARTALWQPDQLEPVPLTLPGWHNQLNAGLALALCEALNFSRETATAALARFRGIERRLECAGSGRGVSVFDDYAHNPAKIQAAWTALANPGTRVLGAWRPHGYGPLNAMAPDLIAMWQEVMRRGDRLYILPVYYAGGTTNPVLTSADFAGQLCAAGVDAMYVEQWEDLATTLLTEAQKGDHILCMGARDPYWPVFARQLVQSLRAGEAG
jgi:UDP-N-acetylmuramate--alanine ligase